MQINRRILIVSPNLEQGYCGVSDYVFILKSFFENDGFQCSLLALSDMYCNNLFTRSNILRIPSETKSRIKLYLANNFISNFKPDIVYFNLVSYGYHKKGLPLYLSSFLPTLALKYKVVIIAHELWPGNFKSESFKNKFYGFLQSCLFINIFRRMHNLEIIVTTIISKSVLKSHEIESKLIPVFNNIPIESFDRIELNPSRIKIFCFGSSLFEIEENLIIEFINKLIKTHNKSVQIDIVGRDDNKSINWKGIAQYFDSNMFFINSHGFSTTQKISQLMQEANLGITTYLPIFWSKSGAIAAMLAHGLPVVSVATEIPIDKHISDSGLNLRIWSINKILFSGNFNDLELVGMDFNYNRNIYLQFNY